MCLLNTLRGIYSTYRMDPLLVSPPRGSLIVYVPLSFLSLLIILTRGGTEKILHEKSLEKILLRKLTKKLRGISNDLKVTCTEAFRILLSLRRRENA